MKNIFKFFGIAAIACSMMVACGQDDPIDEPNDSTPVNPPAPASSVKVVWDGVEQQNLGFTDAYQSSQNEKVFWFETAKGMTNNEYEFPAFIVAFYNGTQGFYPACVYSFLDDINGDGQNDTVNGNYYYPSEVYNEGGIEIQGVTYGDYQLMGYVGNDYPVMNFDATTRKLSGNFTLAFADYMAYQQGQTVRKDLELTFVEYPFDAAK